MKLSNDDKYLVKMVTSLALGSCGLLAVMLYIQNLSSVDRRPTQELTLQKIEEIQETTSNPNSLEAKIESPVIIEQSKTTSKPIRVEYNLTDRPQYDKKTGKCMYNGIEALWEIPTEKVREMIVSVTGKDIRYYCMRFTGEKDLSELDFQAKDIRGSDFSKIGISGSDFRRAYAQGAIFIDVIADEKTDFTNMTTDKYTIKSN